MKNINAMCLYFSNYNIHSDKTLVLFDLKSDRFDAEPGSMTKSEICINIESDSANVQKIDTNIEFDSAKRLIRGHVYHFLKQVLR